MLIVQGHRCEWNVQFTPLILEQILLQPRRL